MRSLRIGGFGLVFGLTLVGGLALAAIEGSKHDFSNKAWSGGDACGVCHGSHREELPKATPLWNPKADLTRMFGENRKPGPEPGFGTALCVRCHDGTIAKEAVTGVRKGRYANKVGPQMFRRWRSSGDHPVGVRFPQFDKGFRPETSVVASGTVRLPEGRVECVSCHDPHDQSGYRPMLVMSNARSALCLTCHKK